MNNINIQCENKHNLTKILN